MLGTSISIIIPVYNTDLKTIKKCLSSISLSDNEINKEVVIIFDGQPMIDVYEFVLNARFEFEKKILLIDHAGVSAARNSGLKLCNNEWVMFVDADDCVVKYGIKNLIHYGVENNCEVVMGAHRSVMGNGSEIHRFEKHDTLFLSSELDRFCAAILCPERSAGLVWGKIFSRNLLVRNCAQFNTNISFGEDAEFTFCVCKKTKCIGYVNKVVYNYNRNPESVVRKFSNDYVENVCRAISAMGADLRQFPCEYFSGLFDNFVLYHLTVLMINYLFNPGAPWNNDERKTEFKRVLNIHEFDQSLIRFKGRGFSPTRIIAIYAMRFRLYYFCKFIAYIRYKQFGN